MNHFKMNRIMNTTMNRILTGCLAFAAITTVTSAQSVHRVWEFPTDANPAVSVAGPGRAGIAPGDFASGWIGSDPVYGTAVGIWDLGRSGTIILTDPAVLGGADSPRREITVRVTQWVDGGIYANFADVAVPGATLATFDERVTRNGTIGGWMEDGTVWSADAGVVTDKVLVTGYVNGSLVDQVSVELRTFTVEPAPALSVRRVSGGMNRVELSWTSAGSGWVVQTSESITDVAGWQPLEGSVSVVGDRHSVVAEATGGARFFRLSKP